MTGRGAEPFSGETLRADNPERQTQLRIVSRVVSLLPDRDDYMPVLRALLAPSHALPPHGSKEPPEVKAARREWRERCRAWLRAQGLEPGQQIARIDQCRYEAATGDVWETIRAEVGR